jgi:hypothetical protein
MKVILFSVSAIFLLVAIFFTFYFEKKNLLTHKNYQGVNLDSFLNLAQEGDIILKQGRGPISKRIVKILNEETPFSHLGILCKQKDSFFIVHSISKNLAEKDGVQTITIKQFIGDSKPGTVWLVRRNELEIKGTQIQEVALKMANSNIPFDKEYNHHNADEIYCSELALVILNNLNDTIECKFIPYKNNVILGFSSFINPRYFKIIYK